MSHTDIYDVLIEQVPLQSDTINSSIQSIETKTGFLMASIGVFIPVIINTIQAHQNINVWFLTIGLFFEGLTLLFNTFCLWDRKFMISPNIKNFYTTFKGAQIETIQEEMLVLKHFDLEKNRNRLAKKATAFNISVVTFCIGTILIGIALFVQPIINQYNDNVGLQFHKRNYDSNKKSTK